MRKASLIKKATGAANLDVEAKDDAVCFPWFDTLPDPEMISAVSMFITRLVTRFERELCHTKGTWAGKPFKLLDWQEQIIRDLFGTVKPNGYRQFNTAYIEIPKKNGKSELAAAPVK